MHLYNNGKLYAVNTQSAASSSTTRQGYVAKVYDGTNWIYSERVYTDATF